MAKANYRIQGWKPNRVYPDFITAGKSDTANEFDKLYILETKGEHLIGSEDTDYKRSLLKLCNELAIEKSWQELNLGFNDTDFVFQMIDQDGWKSQLNGLFVDKK